MSWTLGWRPAGSFISLIALLLHSAEKPHAPHKACMRAGGSGTGRWLFWHGSLAESIVAGEPGGAFVACEESFVDGRSISVAGEVNLRCC